MSFIPSSKNTLHIGKAITAMNINIRNGRYAPEFFDITVTVEKEGEDIVFPIRFINSDTTDISQLQTVSIDGIDNAGSVDSIRY